MAYVNVDSIFTLLPAFEPNKDTVYASPMAASLFDAEGIVNGVLGSKYNVPFPDYNENPEPRTPAIVQTITNMLTRSIFLSGCYLSDAANAEPAFAKLLWDRAWMMLEKIMCGEISIISTVGGVVQPLSTTRRGIYSNTIGRKPSMRFFDMESRLCPQLHVQMRSTDPSFPYHLFKEENECC